MALGSLNDLYRDKVILDHCRHPRNSVVPNSPDICCEAVNPFCGDEIRFQLKLDYRSRIKEVGFQGEGCAINQAAGSIVSDSLIGLTSVSYTHLPSPRDPKTSRMPSSA